MNTEKGPAAIDEWDLRASREAVLKLPHFMVMFAYVIKTYDVPRYGWRNQNLRYHYTDAAGLIGIVTSHRLWATDIRFLNDPSEGRFLPEKILGLMESRASRPSARKIVDEIRRKLVHPREESGTFSVSFCANGDLLSQWRGYGHFGKGYSIGLDIHKGPHAQLGALYDVCYGEEHLEDIANDLLDIYVSASEKWGHESMCEEAATLLRALASSFKDPSYEGEQESRIVLGYTKRDNYLFENEAPLKFHSRGGDIIPYIPLALNLMKDGDPTPKLPIRRIITGPGVDFERNRSSLTRLLEDNGYKNVEIVPSSVPFRP